MFKNLIEHYVFVDDPVQRKGIHMEQREKLGLCSGHKERTNSPILPSQTTNAVQKVEVRNYVVMIGQHKTRFYRITVKSQ